MSTYYFYLVLLLLMFILIYNGISYCLKYAPAKIKIISFLALIAVSFRVGGLLIMFISKNIKNLYLLKPVIFLNLISLPVLAITALYILSRNDKIKFNYCLVADILLLAFYIAVIIKFPINIELYGNLGYIMSFISKNVQYGFYIIINTILLFQAVIFLDNKTSNKLGMYFILVSALTVILESILRLSGVIIFPAVIIGDIFWIGTLDYALCKLKK